LSQQRISLDEGKDLVVIPDTRRLLVDPEKAMHVRFELCGRGEARERGLLAITQEKSRDCQRIRKRLGPDLWRGAV
jgi:hypothetical protein